MKNQPQALLEGEANLLWKQGKLDEAAKKFLELKRIAPENHSLLLFSAEIAMHRQQFPKALAFLELIATNNNSPDILLKLAMAYSGCARWQEACVKLDQFISLRPNHLEARLHRGLLLEKLNRLQASRRDFITALRLAETRDSTTLSIENRSMLAHASSKVRIGLDACIEKHLQPVYEEFGRAAVSRIRQCADFFVGKEKPSFSHPMWLPGLFYVPNLPPKMFYERNEIPQLAHLESAFKTIKAELIEVLQADVGLAPYINHPSSSRAATTWKDLNHSRAWSTYHFCRNGQIQDENVQRCPKTWQVLESLDLMRISGYGPEIMFSILAPQTQIKAHHGAVNGRLIVHLPLIVPFNCGAIRVGTEQRTWTEGECLVFDDSFEHEAWNHSSETRAVLIFDIWNPNLSTAERAAFTALHIAAQYYESNG
ncbi:tetratricopeptide repeat protein [Permianibacter sp. IMCC34836]|uniref:aspartyl/asparaginyl beta-hydroxylase domain-containing protein n=1 Tax=Permianibacter fluminis TaxID=2738515 RepID=UPI0015570F04|nr:aspartyl/asparaginyl beta-hydroxylase domain-containing protein [Permianibacter fluminis]NQD38732.1 tetratricopeptide repeat protein [Permianibacter fluminis]